MADGHATPWQVNRTLWEADAFHVRCAEIGEASGSHLDRSGLVTEHKGNT